ncbi:fusaric acid resistance protein FusB [Acetobacter nitrogenifigens DSM 23921 = NBRC 105050]|uniref:Fusaric acid resistance protein n=1 Tax=Acetobacter nitrogenifigens DSM 23921 = NBRC 105050 TaxID=1120919 RepID=A0A511X7S9_9PROT|nr:fusaric acid resistance protein FusB [Acetobacter nitrogenifigens DSM 23921 = NBRC 105050]GEN59006.1 hypothetical protein ANI02nite_08900 [Acetobacter nitrogenifigens DSM 23921 = NBRC 105050]
MGAVEETTGRRIRGLKDFFWVPSFLHTLFPPGAFAFCLRTWLSVSLALAAALWFQISSPATAAVTVMILAQPLRGQTLSKALYRLLGTLIGAFVALFLTACFSQDRAVLLGCTGLWLGLCCVVGTLERDFRAYAAMLAGYTVALIAIGCIDSPQDAFAVTVNRVSAILIGIAATAAVNDVIGAPTAWNKLVSGLEATAREAQMIARNAVLGHSIPDAVTCAELAGRIMALTTQVSYARTEIGDGRVRLAGARSAMVSLMEMLSRSRAIGYALEEGHVSPSMIKDVRAVFESASCPDSPPAAMKALEGLLERPRRSSEGVAEELTIEDAWFAECSMALLSFWRWAEDGVCTVRDGSATRNPAPDFPIAGHRDVIMALLNGLRLLIGFSLSAWLCILSGIPGSVAALSQASIIIMLAATTYNVRAFGMGALIGTPLAVAVAAFLNFFVLTRGSEMTFLALASAPVVFGGCLLLLQPKTSAIGLNAGVFFFVMLGVSNKQEFNPADFVNRNVFYILAALLIFVALTLLLPPSARSRRFRVAMAIGFTLRSQCVGHDRQAGSVLISRNYDRLAHILLWNSYLPKSLSQVRVLSRMAELEDLAAALARARRHLGRAATIATIRAECDAAMRATEISCCKEGISLMRASAERLLSRSGELSGGEMTTVVGAVSGMTGSIMLLQRNRSAINFYKILPKSRSAV